MTTSVESSGLEPDATPSGEAATLSERAGVPLAWARVGAIAAASAILGGLAAAWFYRKTLSQLQEAGHEISDSAPKTIENGTEEDF
jgi:hypothetical protein